MLHDKSLAFYAGAGSAQTRKPIRPCASRTDAPATVSRRYSLLSSGKSCILLTYNITLSRCVSSISGKIFSFVGKQRRFTACFFCAGGLHASSRFLPGKSKLCNQHLFLYFLTQQQILCFLYADNAVNILDIAAIMKLAQSHFFA
ncbi:MAG: hypothetical protein ACI4RV_07520 [Eubacteriales bacterium]